MSKKDYELLARVLRGEMESARNAAVREGVRSTAVSICAELDRRNARFDGARFLRAAGVTS